MPLLLLVSVAIGATLFLTPCEDMVCMWNPAAGVAAAALSAGALLAARAALQNAESHQWKAAALFSAAGLGLLWGLLRITSLMQQLSTHASADEWVALQRLRPEYVLVLSAAALAVLLAVAARRVFSRLGFHVAALILVVAAFASVFVPERTTGTRLRAEEARLYASFLPSDRSFEASGDPTSPQTTFSLAECDAMLSAEHRTQCRAAVAQTTMDVSLCPAPDTRVSYSEACGTHVAVRANDQSLCLHPVLRGQVVDGEAGYPAVECVVLFAWNAEMKKLKESCSWASPTGTEPPAECMSPSRASAKIRGTLRPCDGIDATDQLRSQCERRAADILRDAS